MNSKRQLIMIDDTYEAEYNERLVNHLKLSSKGNFEFKPYKQMKPAFDEMEKYPFNIFFHKKILEFRFVTKITINYFLF